VENYSTQEKKILWGKQKEWCLKIEITASAALVHIHFTKEFDNLPQQ